MQGALIGRLDRAGIVLPWTHQAVGIVIGGEWRRNALLLDFNPVFESGDYPGRVESGGWIRPGLIAVAEIFGELQVPVVDGPIGRLTMKLGFRASPLFNRRRRL